MCAVCEYIVWLARDVIEDHKDALKHLKNLCTLFPEANQDPCKSMVDSYITVIINMLTKGATPQMVCQKIWLCDYAATVSKIKHQDWLIARGRHGDVHVN